MGELSDFEQGIILGILVGEGHFGGDGRQAQVTLKMHVRHESLVRWLHERIDGSKIYGPYHYDGRHFLQLMIRGEGLKRVLVPMLSRLPWKDLDAHSYERFRSMCERYRLGDEVVSPGSSPVKRPIEKAGTIHTMYRPHPLDLRLAAVLPAAALYAVGGRVRDELRAAAEGFDSEPKDLDYVVTGVPLADLQARLSGLGRVDLVGAAFAVLKVTVDGETVDVALPRRERSTGVGHRDFAVQSGPEIPLEDDLARRDFRMNMIARSLPGGDIVDPHGGAADIRAHRIDVLTPRTFEEDPLRLLRAAQFAARFSYLPSAATLAGMRSAAALISTVSPERSCDEFTKLFERAPKPSIGLELLRETGVLAHLWPELLEGVGIEQNEWHAYDVWRHNLETMDALPPGDAVLRIAALLHDVGKPRTKDGPHFYRHELVGAEMARDMLRRLRFSNDAVDTVEHLVRHHMYNQDPNLTDAAVRRFVRRIGLSHLRRQFAMRQADIAGSGMPKRDGSNEAFEARVWAEVERKPPFSIADLAIGGSDVIDAMVAADLAPPGFRGDHRVGSMLRWLFEQVTDRPERNSRQTLRALLDAYLRSEGNISA